MFQWAKWVFYSDSIKTKIIYKKVSKTIECQITILMWRIQSLM